jgi:hypothetical protein
MKLGTYHGFSKRNYLLVHVTLTKIVDANTITSYLSHQLFAEYSTTTKVIDCFESYPTACSD